VTNSILVVAAHPDDEVLGCGGTIAKHVFGGDSVSVLFMTNGVSARDGDQSLAELTRKQSSLSALKKLGVEAVCFEKFPDNTMDVVPLIDVVKVIEKYISEKKPNIIYTHFSEDLNVDHRVTHQAVMTACRPQSWSSVKEIYCFEVLSSTEWNSSVKVKFNPTKFVDITEYYDLKMDALLEYKQEMREFPHSRSVECVEALAVFRGAIVGLNRAEAFQIERIIN